MPKKWDKPLTIEDMHEGVPSYSDMASYYWTALIRNEHHKMAYMKLKSRLHRTENIVDLYTRSDIGAATDMHMNQDELIYDVMHRIEWLMTDYGRMLWTSRAPYELFIHKYLFYRADILNNLLTIDNPTGSGATVPPPECDVMYYNNIFEPDEPRTKAKLIKHTIYLASELITMLEFVKNDIDRNDDLMFKLIILTINGLIFMGQIMWNIYN